MTGTLFTPAPGVHVLRTPPHPVFDRFREEGWRVGVVAGAVGKTDVLRAVGITLGLPAHFGHNLDALWDCLTDLTAPTALMWEGWEETAAHHPEDWAGLMAVFGDRAAQPPSFALVLVSSTD